MAKSKERRGNNKRLKIKYLFVFSILLQCIAVRATTIPLREIGANGAESDEPTERCNCMGCSPCTPPVTPPPVTPPPVTPPPVTPPPVTPPPVTPPPVTPPPVTPPPVTPPPVTPPPVTPPPVTPPPVTPPPVTPPPVTPPPVTPPPVTPPTTQPPAITHQPICTTIGDPTLPQLLPNYCHQCSNPNCASSPNGATFPYPNHCQFFWKCENGLTTVCYCPNGMWFDRVLHSCNYCPNVTNCPANIN